MVVASLNHNSDYLAIVIIIIIVKFTRRCRPQRSNVSTYNLAHKYSALPDKHCQLYGIQNVQRICQKFGCQVCQFLRLILYHIFIYLYNRLTEHGVQRLMELVHQIYYPQQHKKYVSNPININTTLKQLMNGAEKYIQTSGSYSNFSRSVIYNNYTQFNPQVKVQQL